MIERKFWIQKVRQLLEKRSVLWISGARRVGKTFLCQSLPQVEYFDCELPRVRRSMSDPESFLRDLEGKLVVLDEIHRLDNPSELLKIAADHVPGVRVIATGSSTLGASARFKDTLSGRKLELWLTPMLTTDLRDFGRTDLPHRLLRGGLPPFFLADALPEREFQEWIDSFWAKDVQELFRLERKQSFQRFVELLLSQSGGIFEASGFAAACGVSRPTIGNYLAVLEATHIVHVLRPFSSHKPSEIVAAPKVYGFDTGFVCYHRGWSELRGEDMGLLWEHFVLNEIQGRLQRRDIRYWRDKAGHEIDFVVGRRGAPPTVVECKWSAADFDPAGLRAFRRRYPGGKSYVVARDVDRTTARAYGDIQTRQVGIEGLIEEIEGQD
jgi:predicted AAA+ superfamily ATPase